MSNTSLLLSAEWTPGSYLDLLNESTRAELLAMSVPRQFGAGHRLMRQGDVPSHVELLIRGYVKITSIVEDTAALLAIRAPGDILGEMSTVTGSPRMATVTTCGRVVSAVVGPDEFRRFLNQHADAAVQMAATMGNRLRWANQRRADHTAYPAEVRLARVLVDLAATCGRRTGEGISIGVSLSQPELATMIGVADATGQKALRDLRERHVISTGYRRVLILDLEQLRAISEGLRAPTL
jgi:CRP/FNR family transcriptional regulator, cyclic AMP receptor protein